MSIHQNKGFISVNINNELAAYTAVDYLCKKGHTDIIHIAGEKSDLNAGQPRMQGYIRALKANGIPVKQDNIYSGSYSFDDGIRNTQDMLARGKKFSAIFAASDTMAIGALNVLNSNGYKIPEDVSVVGFDDLTIARYASPALTTIRQPRYKMGNEGAVMLHLLLSGKNVEVQNYILDFELIIRDSTN